MPASDPTTATAHTATDSSEMKKLLDSLEPTDQLVERALELKARRPKASGRSREAVVLAAQVVPSEGLGDTTRKLIEDGLRAVEKLAGGRPEADLTPVEQLGREAIILLTGRPALLIQDGRFFAPPRGWEALDQQRDPIQKHFPSVGRIEVDGHPAQDWVGTGFVVGDRLVITNRHVAKEFCRRDAPGQWAFEPGMTARIDFLRELGAEETVSYAIEAIVGIHETVDLALFRIAPHSTDGQGAPPPLPVATADGLTIGRRVYVIGYPAWDGRRNDPEVMARIFSSIYGVKRLQPGEVRTTGTGEITHDCSTLGGNSGSPVIDLESHCVVGLHYSGRFREANRAVHLADFRTDALVGAAGLNYVGSVPTLVAPESEGRK